MFEAHAARIAERDPAINALVLPRLDEAREEAIDADAAAARGPLHGVPMRPGGKLTLATCASALGLPAVCVPAMRAEGSPPLGTKVPGLAPSGLPVGVQLIGARRSELTLLSLAAELESGLGGWLAPS